MNSFLLVDGDSLISTVTQELDQAEVIGIDAERASGFKYGQDAYLVQLIADSTAFLVDPTGLSEQAVQQLAATLNSKEWILHSATQDLPCLNALGLYPKSIFDTELASKLAGFEKFGLASLVSEILGFELKKEHSAADWSIRPLSNEMLEYAAQDVYHLHQLRDILLGKITELDRLDMAAQEFEHLLRFKPKEQGPNPWRRTTGIHNLTKPIQLARLREMWWARDKYASENDIAPGRVVSDRSLAHAASQEYKSIPEMRKDKAFHGRLLPKIYTELFEAYKSAESTEMPPLREKSTDPIPHHKNWQKLKPEVDARYKKLKERLAITSAELSMPVENLMSPALIRAALWKELSADQLEEFFRSNQAREWQSSLILPLIADLL